MERLPAVLALAQLQRIPLEDGIEYRPIRKPMGVSAFGINAYSSDGGRVIEEIAIVQPKIIVVMGTDALDILNDLQLPLAREVLELPGEVQRLTPSIEALYVPDIDRSLDEESAKRDFWRAFRVLGEWWSDFPPY